MSSRLSALVVLAVVAASCSSAVTESAEVDTPPSTAVESVDTPTEPGPPASIDPASVPRGEVRDFGPAPEVPEGEVSEEIAAAFDSLFGRGTLADIRTDEQNEALVTLGNSGDPRVAWVLMDLLRFTRGASDAQRLTDGANTLTNSDASTTSAWGDITDKLIAWDIPAPPGYTEIKKTIYSTVLPEWGALFEQSEAMDWRFVSWGGVRIDDRGFDMTDEPCNCIPAADNPTTESAAEATWLEDDDVVFGVVINGEARAYPRQIMEVREMVNDTLGGRDFAMPYCTLCGAAQVWFTDDVPDGVERPVLRTSGLLSRSNKVMYDLNTFSVFDTFVGDAQTGPLSEIGVQLNQHTVVTSTWADWKAEHPDTDVLIEELALGRDFDFRNNRDADGPIFPIGDVDPRLPIQEDVLGVLTDDGPIAFHVASALAALDRGETIEVDGIRILKSGSGVRAEDTDGNDLGGHQAFWFAWSQFYEDTTLWPAV